MRYHLSANGSELEVTLKPLVGASAPATGHGVTACLKGEGVELQRDLLLIPGLVQSLQEDGSLRRLAYTGGVRRSDSCSFFYKGRLREVVSVGGVGGRVEGSQSEGSVSAPMNGQVVKVLKRAGDEVQDGEVILILEAMKMENEVTAPTSGVLVEVLIEPGETVTPGQPLFTIEPTEQG